MIHIGTSGYSYPEWREVRALHMPVDHAQRQPQNRNLRRRSHDRHILSPPKDFSPESIPHQKIELAEEIDLGKELDINRLIELAMQRSPELSVLREKALVILAEARADRSDS